MPGRFPILLAAALGALLLVGAGGGLVSAATPICGSELPEPREPSDLLRRFGRWAGVRHVDVFVKIVHRLHETGSLPPCYLTKRRARESGWSPGSELWEHAPGTAIGGDRFGNLERRLPAQYNGQYLEADLDYEGGRRGAKRLVFVPDRPGSGLIWITTDHYRTFEKVPLR